MSLSRGRRGGDREFTERTKQCLTAFLARSCRHSLKIIIFEFSFYTVIMHNVYFVDYVKEYAAEARGARERNPINLSINFRRVIKTESNFENILLTFSIFKIDFYHLSYKRSRFTSIHISINLKFLRQSLQFLMCVWNYSFLAHQLY